MKVNEVPGEAAPYIRVLLEGRLPMRPADMPFQGPPEGEPLMELV